MNIKRLLNKIRRENSLDLANFNYRTDSNGLVISELKNTILTEVIVPDGVTEISKFAFAKSRIANVSLPNSLIYIDDFAFDGCESLELINIPESVTYIGESAFRGCVGLKNMTLPNSVKTIGMGAFAGCENIEKVKLGGIDKINPITFFGCKRIVNIVIPDGVKIIGSAAFRGCASLSAITLPNSTKAIGEYAFAECANIDSIAIPENIVCIGQNSFDKCDKLASVRFVNTNGWYLTKNKEDMTGMAIDVTDPIVNADSLRGKYKDYYLKRINF